MSIIKDEIRFNRKKIQNIINDLPEICSSELSNTIFGKDFQVEINDRSLIKNFEIKYKDHYTLILIDGKKGLTFKKHKHVNDEVIFIFSGEIKDTVTNKKSKNQIKFKRDSFHECEMLSDSSIAIQLFNQ